MMVSFNVFQDRHNNWYVSSAALSKTPPSAGHELEWNNECAHFEPFIR